MAKINIAIDGFSSCGKGTLAKYLADSLQYVCIDTGAMYRALTWYALQQGLDCNDEEAVVGILPEFHLDMRAGVDGSPVVMVNGHDVSNTIRSMEVAGHVSKIAAMRAVRKFLVAQQQKMAKNGGVVMDGRDIGTVVLPNAEVKIFMTARPEIRAERRFKELVKKGQQITFEEVLQNVNERDYIDSNRADSPLAYNDTYLFLDNSDMTPDAQNALAMQWVKRAIAQVESGA